MRPLCPLRHPASIRARLIPLVLAVWLPAVVGLGLQARSTYLQQERLARNNLQQVAQNLDSAIVDELDKRRVLAQA